jgi:hypothetical protein
MGGLGDGNRWPCAAEAHRGVSAKLFIQMECRTKAKGRGRMSDGWWMTCSTDDGLKRWTTGSGCGQWMVVGVRDGCWMGVGRVLTRCGQQIWSTSEGEEDKCVFNNRRGIEGQSVRREDKRKRSEVGNEDYVIQQVVPKEAHKHPLEH